MQSSGASFHRTRVVLSGGKHQVWYASCKDCDWKVVCKSRKHGKELADEHVVTTVS